MNAFLYTENATSLFQSNFLIVDVPRGLSNKNDLLSWYSAALKFPEYFGNNWDAFLDCLRDLHWIQEQKIIIHHHDVPLGESPPDQKIYVEVLAEIAKTLGSFDGREVVVTFPPACKPTLQKLTG